MTSENGILKRNTTNIEYAAITDKGRVRAHNEDGFLILPEEAVFCIADGAGGHKNGAHASSLVLETIKNIMTVEYDQGDDTLPIRPIKDDDQTIISSNSLSNALDGANIMLFRDNPQKNMASTLIGCKVEPNFISIINVGDSRGYLYRHETLTQLTEDHSVVWQLYKANKISFEDMRTHPRKNVITKAMGVERKVLPGKYEVKYLPEDILIFCSDGLTAMLTDKEIQQHLHKNETSDLPQTVETICSAANLAGGRDNITVLMLRISKP